MLIKTTIIFWIISVVLFFLIKLMILGLSAAEKLQAVIKEQYPPRVLITVLLWLIVTVLAIFCTIVSVVRW